LRDGRDAKDGVTMLPESIKATLQEHLRGVKIIHEQDLADGWGRVPMPDALDRKYSHAPSEWRWQWVYPQEHRRKNTRTGEEGRHHMHETILQRAVKEALARPALLSTSDVIASAIRFPRTCSNPATTSGPSRSSWGTKKSRAP
jgi:hypothetical protein